MVGADAANWCASEEIAHRAHRAYEAHGVKHLMHADQTANAQPAPLTHLNDAALLSLLHQPDQRSAAFEVLFTRHYAAVWRVLYHMCASPDEAEDLLQETFLTLYQQPPHLNHEHALVGWLCRVALNRGYNSVRGQRRREQREAQRYADPTSYTATLPDPATVVLRHEEREQVRRALLRLPERQSRILLLRYGGLAYAEIAAALELAPSSVGTLLARAERAFLAQYRLLAEAGFEPSAEPAAHDPTPRRSLV